ncbi:MAG TPA: TIGR02594 family protein [Gemmataceae bacterium]|nr:TIGR02594 family protein [Gemmataceae bacterium]
MTRYKVTASSLNVREEPKLTGKVIGYLSLDEIVEGVSISGDGYWHKIKRDDGLEGWSSHKFLVAYEGERDSEEFPWMAIALPEMGTKEYAGAADNPRIVEYLSSTNLGPSDQSNDETPWCSAFVNWCVEKAGYEGTDSAWAKSWLTWGKNLAKPRRGCIAVFKREGGGHVGFYIGKTSTGIKVLGGNQSDEVNISTRLASTLLGYRVPG